MLLKVCIETRVIYGILKYLCSLSFNKQRDRRCVFVLSGRSHLNLDRLWLQQRLESVCYQIFASLCTSDPACSWNFWWVLALLTKDATYSFSPCDCSLRFKRQRRSAGLCIRGNVYSQWPVGLCLPQNVPNLAQTHAMSSVRSKVARLR